MTFPVFSQYDTTLEPGRWTGFAIEEASLDRAFVAAYELAKPASNSGFLEKSVFQPEWDGSQWNTVLRLQMSPDVDPQPVKISVYEVSGMHVHQDLDVTLEPGRWQGYSMGECDLSAPFIAAFSPDTNEGFLETHRFQPEWDGTRWNTVLRLQIPEHMKPMKLRVRVFRVTAPVVQTIDAKLKGGAWQGYDLGPATTRRGFLAAYAPKKPPVDRGFLEKSRVQPEWDGSRWNSVLRLQASSDLPTLDMPTQVFGVGE